MRIATYMGTSKDTFKGGGGCSPISLKSRLKYLVKGCKIVSLYIIIWMYTIVVI